MSSTLLKRRKLLTIFTNQCILFTKIKTPQNPCFQNPRIQNPFRVLRVSQFSTKFPEYEMPSVTWGVVQGKNEKLVNRVKICDYLKGLGIIPDELENLELPSTVEVMEQRVSFLQKLGLTVDDINEYPLMLGCSRRKNMIPVLSYLEKIGIQKSKLGEFVKNYPQALHASVVVELMSKLEKMNSPVRSPVHDEDDQGEVYLDESDIIHEVTVDDEDIPDVDEDEIGSDAEPEPDDSVHIFTGHTDELYTVACSPTDATLVATGGGDDKGFFWRINRGDWASEIQGHKDSVSSLAFSTDGQLLASGGFDGLVQIWDTSSGILKCALDGPGGGIEWVRWHLRGHVVLAGSEDSTVWMWNADRGAYLNMFSGHGSSVTCGDFTPDGKTICTGSDDATLRIWNPKSGENNHVIRGHPYHTEGLTCLTISSDSTLALTGSKDGSVHMVNITTGKVVSSLVSHTDSIECIVFAPSSPWAATGSMDQKLIIWDLQHSSPRSTCDHEEGVTCLTWLGTSRYLITGSADGKVRVWDSLSGDCVRTFSGHSNVIQSISVSANRDFVVSVSLDGTARVFEIAEFQ